MNPEEMTMAQLLQTLDEIDNSWRYLFGRVLQHLEQGSPSKARALVKSVLEDTPTIVIPEPVHVESYRRLRRVK